MPEKYLYLLVNALTILGPLARSFEPKIAFYKQWRAILGSIVLVGTFFILWDSQFAKLGVWGFNGQYLVGIHSIGLPLEEWLFFVTVPFACLFLYEVAAYFVPRDIFGPSQKVIAGILIVVNLALLAVNFGALYTTSACGLLVLLLVLHAFILKSPWLGRFFLAFSISLVPFLLVNGVLTGAITENPVVWYNDHENLGIRIGTIPLEDVFYGMDLLLLGTWAYLWLKSRR